MTKEIKELNNEILRVTQSVVVHAPNYSKFGGYEGERDIHTMDIAKALYDANRRKRNGELNEMIEWCRKKMREEREKPYGLSGKRLEGYDTAMKAVMSFLHGLKGE